MLRHAPRLTIRLKLLLIFTLLFTGAFGVSFLWFYNFATQLAMDNLRGDLVGTAQTAARLIDAEQHRQLYAAGIEGDATYEQLATELRHVRDANPKVTAIYTMVPGQNSTTLEFVVSADENFETRAHLREEYDISEYPQMLAAFNGPTADPDITRDSFGTWFSGYAPIRGTDGNPVAIVGVDMTAQEVVDIQNRILATSIEAFAIVYFLLFAAVFLISVTMTRSLKRVTTAAQALERGEQVNRQALEAVANSSDELGQLARIFSQMAVEVQARETRLKQEVAQLKIEIDVAKQNKQVEEITETDYFQDLQRRARALRSRPETHG